MMSKSGKIYTGIGLLLLAAALFLTVYNFWSDARAGDSADRALESLASDIREHSSTNPADPSLGGDPEEVEIPDYILNPEMDMPEEEVDGRKYIGVLRIPELSIELPVISEWSYPALRKAPCRYSGSVYLNNMVIAAHNYRTHFGRLKDLSQGDEVSFTDVDGNVFRYKIVEIESLSPYATEEMTSGDWNLTLFTCTPGGRSRVTVRCELIEK